MPSFSWTGVRVASERFSLVDRYLSEFLFFDSRYLSLNGFFFPSGFDLHLAVDCNFSHRHNRTAGDSPSFFEPQYFLSKEYVESIGDHIEKQRGKGPSPTFLPKVPDVAVDEDENAFEAASEKKAKTNDARHDDTGLGALLCRHDNPIFLVNVDSPGEQQKYAVAMITQLFEYLPQSATVAVLYDVGCVLDRSNGLVSKCITYDCMLF